LTVEDQRWRGRIVSRCCGGKASAGAYARVMGVPVQQGKQRVHIVVPVIKSDADASLVPVDPKKIMRSCVRITAPCVM
jgi:hypothetical protein